tara:strand:- start:2202 stop:3563 length:1362 start_codon:yes stop_codon:yes gene_type:complete
MSIYNSRIKTHLIKPVYDGKNIRSEFRLESNTAYLSNMRLMDIGVTMGGTDQGQYNRLCGAYGVIKSIHLYDNNTLLDQQLENNLWSAWKQVNKTNQDNLDMNFITSANNAGSIYKAQDDQGTGIGSLIGDGARFDLNTAPLALNTAKGWLNLKEVFPLLTSLQYLDTALFQRIRIVIHYHNNGEEFMANRQTIAAQPKTTTEPLLIVDEIVGDGKAKVMGKFNGVNYTTIEHDRVRLSAVVPTATEPNKVQSQTFKISGFNNKNVGRMLIIKSPIAQAFYTDPATADGSNIAKGGKLQSVGCFKEIIQMRKNGNALLTGRGLESSAQRLAMVNDIWGQCSIPPFSNGIAYETDIKSTDDAKERTELLQRNNKDIGSLDYVAFDLRGERVLDLQFDYQRSGVYVFNTTPKDITGTDDAVTLTSKYNQALDLHFFAEVDKSIVVQGGKYQVLYS